jgi:hypothetical protein
MVVGATQSMLKVKGLPGWLWEEAVIMDMYLLNRVPCKVVDRKMPFEVRYGKRPTMHLLKTSGCISPQHEVEPEDFLQPWSQNGLC